MRWNLTSQWLLSMHWQWPSTPTGVLGSNQTSSDEKCITSTGNTWLWGGTKVGTGTNPPGKGLFHGSNNAQASLCIGPLWTLTLTLATEDAGTYSSSLPLTLVLTLFQWVQSPLLDGKLPSTQSPNDLLECYQTQKEQAVCISELNSFLLCQEESRLALEHPHSWLLGIHIPVWWVP